MSALALLIVLITLACVAVTWLALAGIWRRLDRLEEDITDQETTP